LKEDVNGARYVAVVAWRADPGDHFAVVVLRPLSLITGCRVCLKASPVAELFACRHAVRRHPRFHYLAINLNSRIPTLVDGYYVLWESNFHHVRSLPRLSAGHTDLSVGAEAARPDVVTGQRQPRSTSSTQTTRMSVTAAAASRAVQLMPRPTHHNSAQYIRTGTMMSSDSPFAGMRR
jgi:hypothetical protein